MKDRTKPEPEPEPQRESRTESPVRKDAFEEATEGKKSVKDRLSACFYRMDDKGRRDYSDFFTHFRAKIGS